MIDGTLIRLATTVQTELGGNGTEGVHNILQSSRTGATPSDTVYCHVQDALAMNGGVLPLCRSAVDVFDSLSQQINFLSILSFIILYRNFFLVPERKLFFS